MKPIKKFNTIKQVASNINLPQHVLRFWENKFKQLKPLKLSGNRRYYRQVDIDLIIYIKSLLHEDHISIKGVQKIFGNQTINQILKNKNPILNKKNVLTQNKILKKDNNDKNNKNIFKEILVDLKKIKNSI
ncbi:MAG: hypothetical protein CFH26_00524 [Alphaproteobacteria bacterium MarineAlpha6_Bin4]|nr:MAG: hypothetical protein CFH25_00030 [Alphaproteobacteria bacterium MarineAlpha6_Bin3]PPR37805.1 MAG: hypothetical protein CFH26_00524 [Alphaproteobacteria bacterium MarineAlpha6_Bin4]